MILLRKFRVLILMVFLVACSMHIMIDLLPKLERRGNSGCSCSHTPSEEPGDWAQKQLQPLLQQQQQQQGWPNKHTLRILQDFSNEPNSNVSSNSLEKNQFPPVGHNQNERSSRQPDHQAAQRGDPKRHSPPDVLEQQGVKALVRLAALYEHPLFKTTLPALTDEDTLFNVNTDIRFDPKAAEDQEW